MVRDLYFRSTRNKNPAPTLGRSTTSLRFFKQTVAFILVPWSRGNEINATFDLCELSDFCSNLLNWLVFRCVCPAKELVNGHISKESIAQSV